MTRNTSPRTAALLTALLAGLAACSHVPETQGPARKELVRAVTQDHRLISFNAGQPGRVLSDLKLTGLASGETVLGIDYRVAKGELYALGSTGRVFRVDVATGQLTPLGSKPFALKLEGSRFGFDFNPAADRIRIVSETGQNLRAHPDSGELVDASADTAGVQADGRLHYAEGDAHARVTPQIIAAGYTYNKDNEKLTTNYALDAALSTLVRQGSVEGQQPVVSPNLGKLFTVGGLGVGEITDAHFDIADLNNAALAAVTTKKDATVQLHEIDLRTGRAIRIGRVADGKPLRGIAIEP